MKHSTFVTSWSTAQADATLACAETHPADQVSPAALLPSRVLSIIFAGLQECSARSKFEPQEHGFQSPFVAATTWVCRRWREAALSLPWLWLNIDIDASHHSPEEINTLIDRAGDELLSVSVDGIGMASDSEEDGEAALPAACALLHAHGHRISHLCLNFAEHQAPAIEELVRHLGPSLVTLQVFCDAPAVAHRLRFDPSTVRHLRALTASNIPVCPAPAAAMAMHALRDLTLESLWGDPGCTYVHDLLAAAPHLESLDLTDSLPSAPTHPADSQAPVLSLPKLRTLWINDLAHDMAPFLTSIAVPASASVSLTARYNGAPPACDSSSSSGSDARNSTTVLPMDVLPHAESAHLPALAQTRDLALHLGTACCGPDIELAGGSWILSFPSMEHPHHHHHPHAGAGTGTFAHHVLDGLPTTVVPAHVLYLELHLAPHMPAYTRWADVLGAFPRVRALTVGGRRAFDAVVGALALAGAGEKRAVLPALTQLTACVAVPDGAAVAPGARAFARWLAARAAGGQVLESLIVRVPRAELNAPTVRFAAALVAYMAVRRLRVRVVREVCITCHGKHAHRTSLDHLRSECEGDEAALGVCL